jgi:hypothetical protein
MLVLIPVVGPILAIIGPTVLGALFAALGYPTLLDSLLKSPIGITLYLVVLF